MYTIKGKIPGCEMFAWVINVYIQVTLLKSDGKQTIKIL